MSMKRPRRQRTSDEKAGRSSRPGDTGNGVFKLLIWESEVRAIVKEAARWSKETGGDLFGLWTDTPTVHLATLAGPKAVREATHFRLDVDYLRELSAVLAEDWGLRYFGDWHSHHRLGLQSPSGGDQRRITNIARRNSFEVMAEMIVTFDDSSGIGEFPVRLHPWMYRIESGRSGPQQVALSVMPGISPIREALIARGALPEQNLTAWTDAPATRVRIGDESEPPVVAPTQQDIRTFTERALANAVAVLERVSGRTVELHDTPFGHVLVAAVRDERSIALAVNRSWPPQILEVDAIDRISGKATPIQVSIPRSLQNPEEVAELYRNASQMVGPTEERRDVDSGSA